MSTVLYTVVPCYNEEAVLPETAKRLREKFAFLIANGKISEKSRICFVDDGSRDKTWEIIASFHQKDKLFSGIKLSRNRGHQNALLCGLLTVKDKADCVISMDADLQDDINAVDEMLQKFEDGCEVVYGVRSARKTDSAFKRSTAQSFYKLMGKDLIYNHADYRLLSRRALNTLSEYKEVNLFLRGIVPQLGFKSDVVYYERSERFAGESKYPLKKMLSFAWQGMTSFSDKPIKLITSSGAVGLIAAAALLIAIIVKLIAGAVVRDLLIMLCALFFVGGVQLIALGIVGEYVGKVYAEAKARPRFTVEKFLDE